MSIPRSDLPRVSALPVDAQRRAVDAMWTAYRVAERAGDPAETCPVSWVATMAEMLEAALAAVDRPLRWRTDDERPGVDHGAHQTRPASAGDGTLLEWQPCGEPDPHPPHCWSRAGWTTWRFCAGYGLTDAEFLAMHPLPVPHAFTDAALAERSGG